MPPSVLVCDDEPHVTRIAALKLDRAGFDVQTAANAEAAWQLLQRAVPSLLILDFRLTGVDGLSFLEQLRDDPSFDELPVIVLVPEDVELGDDLFRLRELGVASIVRKPFSARRLVALALECVELAPALT
jgi:DNA-binding response OmpR family regulator